MRAFKFLLLTIVCALPAQSVWAHGFSLSLSGNALVATSNDFPGNGNPFLFNESFGFIAGQLQIDHGGAGTNLFGTGKVLSFDAVGPLWYSDSGAAINAPPGISLLVEDQQIGFTGPFITLSGSSVSTAGFPISGNTSHEFNFTLQGGSIPEGVYGMAYIVKGRPSAGGADYLPTHLLVATWMTPNFDPGADPLSPTSPLSLAEAAIYQAATSVPEPASVVLLGLGVFALALRKVRKRRIASATMNLQTT